MNSYNNLIIEEKMNQILMCYEAYIYSKLGHHYPVTNQNKFTRKEAKQQLLSIIQEEKIKGMLKMVETANCILQADEPAIDEIWFDLDMPDDSIMPMRQDTMLSELKHRLQALKQPNGDKR